MTREIIEKFPKCKLHWLHNHVSAYVYEEWLAKASCAQKKCIHRYDDFGDVVDYHQKVYGADVYARQWTSCGMQRMHASSRAIIAKGMGLTDWYMVNCHPTLFVVQLCERYSVSCSLLTDCIIDRVL